MSAGKPIELFKPEAFEQIPGQIAFEQTPPRYFVLEAAPYWRVHVEPCYCCDGRGHIGTFRTQAEAEAAAEQMRQA